MQEFENLARIPVPVNQAYLNSATNRLCITQRCAIDNSRCNQGRGRPSPAAVQVPCVAPSAA